MAARQLSRDVKDKNPYFRRNRAVSVKIVKVLLRLRRLNGVKHLKGLYEGKGQKNPWVGLKK